ncbi:MAG: hypothetical protein D6685_12930 [Bacteroidetes bacterium]|nr:MAG: hypothetical protein D6685_12930 [Bacteroidota bacterium]
MLTNRALPALIRSGYRLYETVPTRLLVAEQERDQLRRDGHDAVLLIAEPAVAPEPLYFVYWRPGWSASSRKLSAVSRQKATADR